MYLYTSVHCSIVDNSQKVETIQLSTKEWKSKLLNTHTIEYYSAIERNEVLIQATVWMNLEKHAKGNKLGKKEKLLFNSTYMRCVGKFIEAERI